jgi:hypothetical protein
MQEKLSHYIIVTFLLFEAAPAISRKRAVRAVLDDPSGL